MAMSSSSALQKLLGFSEMGHPGSGDNALDQVQTKCSLSSFADATTQSSPEVYVEILCRNSMYKYYTKQNTVNDL